MDAAGEHCAALQHMFYLLAAIGPVSWIVRLRINRPERDLRLSLQSKICLGAVLIYPGEYVYAVCLDCPGQ